MLSEKAIDRINNVLKDNTFNYTGELIQNLNGNINFKIELLGYRNMIRVGEPYPHMRVKITITDIKDRVSRLVLLQLRKVEKEDILRHLDRNMWTFKRGVQNYLSSVLQFFDTENYENVVIDEFVFDYDIDEDELVRDLREQKMSRQATRQVVRDITSVLKKNKSGNFYLPDGGDFYTFSKYPVEFTVELTLKTTKKIEGFKINGNYVPDEEVIEILILFNPNNLKTNLYNIVGELNEVIAHELEHGSQSYKGEFDGHDEDDVEGSLEYYTQSHEIPAQVKGFRRLANLRKQPFEQIVKNWFETHGDIHKLNDEEQEEVIRQVMDYNNSI